MQTKTTSAEQLTKGAELTHNKVQTNSQQGAELTKKVQELKPGQGA
ncbi:hypothetical protein HYD93_03875 [Mycoplasmopsis bovis]|nr:hypothetical protein [Mycoplasmopsis bovis]QQH35269.1 hypothetical protein HYD93_03875 [Mycoplasmopsis bovis]